MAFYIKRDGERVVGTGSASIKQINAMRTAGEDVSVVSAQEFHAQRELSRRGRMIGPRNREDPPTDLAQLATWLETNDSAGDIRKALQVLIAYLRSNP